MPSENTDATDSTRKLAASLHRLLSRKDKSGNSKVIETHISYIILAGEHAYKIKKPVDLGFVNFSSIEKRRFYCQEELRLNRRLAPQFYLDLVPITGSVEKPQLGGNGAPIEYAVRMRRFDDARQLDLIAATEQLGETHIDRLARDLAGFHASAEVAGTNLHFSSPDLLRDRALQNFTELDSYQDQPVATAKLKVLRQWTEASLTQHLAHFERRKRTGRVRECHGDLHLGNMFLDGDHIVMFDCLEFNEDYRWIDVMSDLAFTIMDLDYRKRRDLSHRLLSKYLEYSGDYDGLGVLRHYLVYRALVRAKVAWIRHRQIMAKGSLPPIRSQEVEDHIELARGYVQAVGPTPLLITHGLSGSGKSYVAEKLAQRIGAIQIRSDVERTRMEQASSMENGESGIDQGKYAPDATQRTYGRLLALAANIIDSGYPVIVDATFLTRDQRGPFQELAETLGAPFKILDVQAPDEVLRDRIDRRLRMGGDPSEATLGVLDHQQGAREALGCDELPISILIETNKALDIDTVSQMCRT